MRLVRRLVQSIGQVEALGIILTGQFLVLSGLSQQFVYGQGHLERPILAVVGLQVLAWAVYAVAVWRVLKQPGAVRLRTVLLFAIVFRAVLVPSTPIQEDDFYRYLWDGQVSRAGISPYRYAPAEIRRFEHGADRFTPKEREELSVLSRLASGHTAPGPAWRLPGAMPSRTVFFRINHSGVSTIYPPVAQTVFALIQGIVPWHVQGMRTLLLVFDGLCLLLLIAILKRLALDPARVLIYAWSPLVVKEFANAGHMDTIAMAGVLLCVLMVISRRWALAGASLAVAVASKYYPLVLLPIMSRHLWRVSRQAFAAGLTGFLVTLAICFAPALRDGLNYFRGAGVYADAWRINEGVFGVLAWGTRAVMGQPAELATRLLAGLLFLGLIGWVLRSQQRQDNPSLDLTRRMLLVVGTLFLLSPAAFPWYLGWLIPFLCFHASWPWLLLTGLVQLYYLGFLAEYHYPGPTANALWAVIKCVEYLPFYGMLIWRMRRLARDEKPPAQLAAALA